MKQMKLFDLLDEYSVLIPSLQRNYVHGRENDAHAKEVREHFMSSLCNSCNENKEMKLDVVYGVIHDRNIFVPIDGQQRLTTLWLSAVYAVAMSKDDFHRRKLLSKLSSFSYESRPLASTFCRWLTSGAPMSDFKTQLTQAEDRWGDDPTVRSMIVTLRLVDERFSGKESHLLDAILSRVSFEYSDVHGDASELYVKINARGKMLTQWENLKGEFSRNLDDDTSNIFNDKIEKLSDEYFRVFHNNQEIPNIPDNAFFCLFGRIANYLLQLSKNESSQRKNLEELDKWSLDKEKVPPYVPVEEFKLASTAKSMVVPILRMIDYLLSHSNEVQMPEWDYVDNKLLKVVFSPSNDSQRALTLVLFWYFGKFDTIPTAAFNSSLRLFCNIIINEGADTTTIGVLRTAIEKANNPDIYQNADLHFESDGIQYREEEAKGFIYRNDETANGCIADELWNAEAFLHGRIRMALLDLNNKNIISINHKRLQTICEIRKIWKESKEDSPERRKLIAIVIMAMPYHDGGNKTYFDLYTDNKAIMTLLAQDYDKYLQHSLLDCIIKNGIDVSPKLVRDENPANFQKHFIGNPNPPKWIRDWQENLLWMFDNHPNEAWNHTVKIHVVFYLSQRKGAISRGYGLKIGDFPINDYRFDYYKTTSPKWEEFCKEYCGGNTSIGVTEVRDTGKYGIREGLGINVYFSSWQVDIKAWNSNRTQVYAKTVAYDPSEQIFFEQICQRIDEAESALKENR